MDFKQWMESRIARHTTRRYDWDALKFQEKINPNFRRAQMRYVGTGATGVKTDTNTVPSEHFTLSTMVLPPGHEGPLHTHHDVEEVFFVLKGKGHDVHDGRRYDWEAGDAMIVENACVHQHFSDEENDECILLVMKAKPLFLFMHMLFQKVAEWPPKVPTEKQLTFMPPGDL